MGCLKVLVQQLMDYEPKTRGPYQRSRSRSQLDLCIWRPIQAAPKLGHQERERLEWYLRTRRRNPVYRDDKAKYE